MNTRLVDSTMTPIHKYVYWMLCADAWDVLRHADNPFDSSAYKQMMTYHNRANRQFKTERERRKAFTVYYQMRQSRVDAASCSEQWPQVVTR